MEILTKLSYLGDEIQEDLQNPFCSITLLYCKGSLFYPNVQRMENISILTIKSWDDGDSIHWVEFHPN